MTENRKHQAEPGAPRETAASAQGGGEALRHEAFAGRQLGEQAGRAASEAVRHAGRAGTAAARQAFETGEATLRQGAYTAIDGQQRLVERAAGQMEEVGRSFAYAIQQTAEHMRTMMPQPGVFGTGMLEAQQAIMTVFEGAARSNMRMAEEMVRLASPLPAMELHQRMLRECFGAVYEGQAMLLRATWRGAGEALRPIEQQVARQRGDGGAQAQRPQAVHVADVMSRVVRIASPEDTVQHVARLMREADTGVLPVGENDRLVGMVTDRDVTLRLVAEGRDPARTKVREVMTPEVRYVFEDEEVRRAAETMAEQQVRRLPVLNREKRLVGIVSLGDLAAEGRMPRIAGRALGGIARETQRHAAE